MPTRKISKCHQELIDIINEIAFKVKLNDIEYDIECGSDDFDYFTSGIFKVKIKGIKYGQKVTTTFVIKSQSDKSKSLRFRELYKREYIFYESIVPKLLSIQRDFNIIDGLKLKIPNCVLTCMEYDKEAMAVCDLHVEGFTLLNRFHEMDLDHASLILKNVAKMHALSFALEYFKPEEMNQIKKMCIKDVQYHDPETIPKFLKCYYDNSVQIISNPVSKQKLKELTPNIFSILNKCTLPDTYSVICHGDCWKNNVVFKHKGKKSVDVIFIDYQLVRYASPVTDISYFFYMSAERDLLEKYYDHLINLYYGTLTAVLRQCYLDVENVYPRKIFEKHLQEYSVLGLIEALVSMKIITADTEEALKMTQMKYQSSEDGLCENELQNQSLYVERVNDVVNDFFNRNYSLDAVLNKNK